jgi:hypothetical protein
VSHRGAELGEAWSGLLRAGWPETRARVADGGWRRGQSMREDEAVRNKVRGMRGALAGSKKGAGRVGGCRGREIQRRARVRTLRSTASVEGAELTGQAHGVEREERGRRAMAQRLAIRAHETERERERAGEVTGADRSAPAGRERESVRAQERGSVADRRGPPVRRRGRAGTRPDWADMGRLGCFILFFFSGFSNSFSISFL